MRKAVALTMAAGLLVGCTGSHGAGAAQHGVAADRITIDLHALPVAGHPPAAAMVARSIALIRRRFALAHVQAAILATSGGLRITVVGGATATAATTLATTSGVLRWRQVLALAGGSLGGGPGALPPAASTDVKLAQRAFARYDCGYGSALTGGTDMASDYIVACDHGGNTKYLLAPAAVDRSGVSHAEAAINSTTNQWLVEVDFTHQGGRQWLQLTRRAYEADSSQNPTSCVIVHVTRGCNEIAIVMDGVVTSAPSSQQDGIQGGQTQVTGQFSKQDAENFAAIVDSGPLPIRIGVG